MGSLNNLPAGYGVSAYNVPGAEAEAPANIKPHVTVDTAVVFHVGIRAVLVQLARTGAKGVILRGNLTQDIGKEALKSVVQVGDTFDVVIHRYDEERDLWSVSPREYDARTTLKRMGFAHGDTVDAQIVSFTEQCAELKIGEHRALLGAHPQPWTAYNVLYHSGQLEQNQTLSVRILRWDLNDQALQVGLARPPHSLKAGDPGEATVVLVRKNHLRKKEKLVHYIYARTAQGHMVRLEASNLKDPLKRFPLGSKVPFVVKKWDPYLDVIEAELDWTIVQAQPVSSVSIGSMIECIVMYRYDRGALCMIGDELLGFLPHLENSPAYGPGDLLRAQVQGLPDDQHTLVLLRFDAVVTPSPGHQVYVASGMQSLPECVDSH